MGILASLLVRLWWSNLEFAFGFSGHHIEDMPWNSVLVSLGSVLISLLVKLWD